MNAIKPQHIKKGRFKKKHFRTALLKFKTHLKPSYSEYSNTRKPNEIKTLPKLHHNSLYFKRELKHLELKHQTQKSLVE